MKTISRKEAKAAGLKRYFTGKPCKHGHIVERRSCDAACSVCAVEKRRKYVASYPDRVREANIKCKRKRRLEDPEQARAALRAWHTENPGKYAEYGRKRYAADSAKILEQNRRWRKENPEQKRETDHKAGSKWRKANRPHIAAKRAKRRARELQATPVFADQAAIAKIYRQCAWLTMASSIKHEVDHGVPLNSPVVCGLHTERNLRIITAAENAAKHNHFTL